MVDTDRPAIDSTDEFLALRELLGGARSELRPGAPDGHRRLLDAIAGLGSGRTGDLDITGLVRQALRREEHRSGRAPTLRVPATEGWPSREAWQGTSCEARPDGTDWLRVRAMAWNPAWLPTGGAFDDVAAAVGTEPARRRIDHPVEADPFFTAALGARFSHYSTPGQAQAVRAAMALPAGGTLIVNLPTGSGKTEVAIAPAIVRARRGGTSLLVVPTVSLAQDLERRLAPILAASGYTGPIAFLGNTSQEDRNAIVRGVRQGSVPIVVTSPESAQMTGLRDGLIAAATAGLVRYLAVDEAHLVRAWGGGDFRPHFQSLASLRDRLLTESVAGGGEAPRTLLLSATLGDADIELLSGLFGLPGPLQLVAANAQRPEPEYWAARAPDRDTRTAMVLEAITHLPKPLLLYLTRPIHADEWVQVLRANGLRRVSSVTGASPWEERIGALRGLRGDEEPTTYDVVVATAAFGLGVSYDSIRCIVHACLPESIDRFYQEVGRGGRDGNASISLVVWADADRNIQEHLAKRVVIGWEKARSRWNAMWNNAIPGEDGYARVDLDDYPPYLQEEGSYNHAWNLATLSLMRQAEFIEVRAPGDRRAEAGDDKDAAWTRSLEVRLLSGGLRDEAPWIDAWSGIRAALEAESESQLEAMRRALDPKARICDLLAGAYRPNDDHGFGWAQATLLTPEPLCGRCMACRPRTREEAPSPQPPPPRQSDLSFGPALLRLLGADRTLVALATRPTDPRTAADFIAATVSQGAATILLPDELRQAPPVANAYRAAPWGYAFVGSLTDRFESFPPVPTVAVSGNPKLPTAWFLPRRHQLVVLAPQAAANPFNPQWALNDVAPQGVRVLSVDELLEALR